MKFVTSVFLITYIAFSQVTQEWAVKYNGPVSRFDQANCIALDRFGNIYVAGYSEGIGSNYDYITIKYNPSGEQQWTQRYNGTGNDSDVVEAIAIDSLRNVYITGLSVGIGTGWDIATIKYNSDGVMQWIQRFNGPSNDFDCGLSVTSDDSLNIYVTGFSDADSANGYRNIITIKYDSSGNTRWIRYFDGMAHDYDVGLGVKLDYSGHIIISGNCVNDPCCYDYILIQYNAAGTEQWIKSYYPSGYGSSVSKSFAIDSFSSIIVTGQCFKEGNERDIVTVKFNSVGTLIWEAFFNGTANNEDLPFDVAIDKNNNTFVAGFTRGPDGTWDCVTLKYNPAGVQQWQAIYNSSTEYAKALSIDNLSNVYIACNLYDSENIKFLTIKYDSSGTQKWLQIYNGGDREGLVSDIAVDNNYDVYVTGYSSSSQNLFDVATVKYSQLIGIKPISFEVPNQYALFQNYPNPFNPVTNFEFRIAHFGFVKLTVYDILGQEIDMLVNEELKTGAYKVDWNASNYSSGVYFYTLQVNEFKETKKMVLIK